MAGHLIEYDPVSRTFSVTVAGRIIGFVESYLDGEAVARAYRDGLQAGQATSQRQDGRKALSPKEVAETTGLGEKTVYELLYAGTLAGLKVGARWLIPVAALDAFLGQGDGGAVLELPAKVR